MEDLAIHSYNSLVINLELSLLKFFSYFSSNLVFLLLF
jgi:hypothetical protein